MSTARYVTRFTTKYSPLLYITALAVLLVSVFFVSLQALGELDRYVRSLTWVLAWYALAFYLSWWIVYYFESRRPAEGDPAITDAACVDLPNRRVITLRTFLTYNTPRGRQSSAGADLAKKASGTIDTVGVIVGFSLLIFSFTVQTIYGESLPAHEFNIFIAVLALQLVAIANFLIAIDSLDTTINEFQTFSDDMVHRVRQRFYDRGIAGYYRGLTLLVFSMFLLTTVLLPILTAIGVFTFAYYGYSYWYGYTDDV